MESRNPVFSKRGPVGQRAWGVPTPSPQQLNEMYNAPSYAPPSMAARPMTIDDVVVRGFITLGTLVAAAAVAWVLNFPMPVAFLGVIVGLILALVISFKQSTNPVLILGYAASYGVAVGVISHLFQAFYGVVFQAVVGTALAFGAMLTVYSLRIVRVTPKFTRFVVGAGLALMGLMLVNLLVGLFVDGGIGIRENGLLGIVFSVAAILVGCFFLLLDFNEVEEGVRAGVPEKYSWLMAFGLPVTLVWIYLEILRLLSYFSGEE